MKKLFLILLLCSSTAFAEPNIVQKAVNTSWLANAAVKEGFLLSMVAHGTATGIVESAKYGGQVICTDGQYYHVARLGQDLSSLSTGWFAYSLCQNRYFKWYDKLGLFVEGSIWRSLAFDLSYRYNVTRNPFCYDPNRSFNHKAIVYIEFYNWRPQDAYLSINEISGPAWDIARVAVAAYLHAHIR